MLRGLYAIVDEATLAARGVPLVPFAEAVLAAGPAALQLRAKGMTTRDAVAILRVLAPSCRRAGTLLVMNDDVAAAVEGGADIVHVGQGDAPLEEVRRRAPSLGVGVSTHDETQLRRALAGRPRYVAYGPIFPTASKVDASPVVGVAGLARAFEIVRAEGGAVTPLVGIGGITLERARGLRLDAGAVISELVAEALAEVTSRARLLHTELCAAAEAS